MFRDRNDAGVQLAKKLEQYRGQDAVVLALPRGGVVLGYEVARALALPLDIVTVRKVGHPLSPEYAICAVDDRGTRLCNEEEIAQVDPEWLARETAAQRDEAKRRSTLYRSGREPLPLARKVALIVDDGIATGFSMRLAVEIVRTQKPSRIVVAVPVASAETLRNIEKVADECIVLEPPDEFGGAVGAHYEAFEQVEDREVIELMNEASRTG